MASQYPAQIDNAITLPVANDNITAINSAVINQLREVILNIEETLGIDPGKGFSDVRSRLDFLSSNTITVAGDLSGTPTGQTVIGLQNTPVSNIAPAANQVLQFNGSSWMPAAIPATFSAAHDLSGSSISQTVIGLLGRPLSTTAPANGQSYVWNGSQWAPATINNFSASGDISGNNVSQQVIGINGIPLSTGTLSPTNGDVLFYQSSSGKWINSPSTNIFSPGGDISGSGSVQFIKSISGNNAAGGTVAVNANTLQFSVGQVNPTISQVATSSAPNNLNIKGQTTTNDNNGGNVNIIAGFSGGSGSAGTILLSNEPSIQNTTSPGDIILVAAGDGAIASKTFSGTNAHYIQNGDAGLSMDNNGITLFSLHEIPILFGNAVALGDGYTAIRITTQENDVYFPQLANNGDGYISIDNSGKIAWSEVPAGIFTPGGDISGSSSDQTVIGLQGKQLSSATPSSGQVISFNGSQYAPTSLGGDVSGHIGSTTVSGIQNIPILSGTPTDGYVLTYKQSSNQWQAEIVNSGTLTFGGDVTGLSSANTVGALQNIPIEPGVSNTAPFVGAILQYDGTKYVSTGAPPITIVGQNPPGTSLTSAIDDAPAIQAVINRVSIEQGTNGKIRLANCYLKTPLDLTPLFYSWSSIEIVGNLTIAMNKAELELSQAMKLEGTGATGFSGIFPTGDSNVGMITVVNSANGLGPEPNDISTDGYVDGYFQQEWNVQLHSDSTFIDNPSLIGLQVHITNSIGYDFDGYYTIISAFDGNSPGQNVIRLIADIPYTGPFGFSNVNVHWSCDGYSGTGDFNVFGFPQWNIKVYNCKNIVKEKAYKHWMSLTNCANPEFNYKLWRISGAESDTTVYLGAETQHARTIAGGAYANTVFLPDYGVDGYFNAPTITTYKQIPAVYFQGLTTVQNIAINDSTPNIGFAIDGAIGQETGYCNLYNCYAVSASGSGVPLVIDGAIWVWIEKCRFANAGNLPACIWMACSDETQGQAIGLIYIKDVQFNDYGIIFYSENSGGGGAGSIQITNTNIDPLAPIPFLDNAAAFILVDGLQPLFNVSINDCFLADSFPGIGIYWFETSPFYQTLNNNAGSITEGNIDNVTINMPTEGQAFAPAIFGPIAASLDFLGQPAVNAYNAGLFPMGFNYSTSGWGFTDSMEFYGNATFAPVLTLPFQLPFPRLDNPSDWLPFIAGGTGNFDHTDSSGNPLVGPDASFGKVIRVSTPSSLDIQIAFTVPTPAVGDMFMFFMRAKNTDPTGVTGLTVEMFNGGGITNMATEDIIIPIYREQQQSPWLETVTLNRVTKVSSGAGFVTITFLMGNTPPDGIIVDPESFALLYIPVSAVGTNLTKLDLVKWFRKIRCQVTNATPGDVAIPKRVGLSFGSAARLGTDGYTTTTTSATPIYSAAIPSNNGFNISGTWSAIVPSHIADGYMSGGSFMVIGYNNAGTITSNLQTVGSLINCGASISAAASTPISLTSSGGNIIIEVNSQYSLTTDWQVNINQCNVR